ncbi:MAG: DUF378 domain-containing protein [Planctomycetes bacterium]|jgi:uncharacterized membrane protein YuzA (DUF378 family)|nr:DUF378 domain-containing protein [Planctomycetota bacterium]
MKALNIITLALIIVGGLNWALVGAARFDLVAFITGTGFGSVNIVSRLVYLLVGLSAIYQAGHLIGMAGHHQPKHAAA